MGLKLIPSPLPNSKTTKGKFSQFPSLFPKGVKERETFKEVNFSWAKYYNKIHGYSNMWNPPHPPPPS